MYIESTIRTLPYVRKNLMDYESSQMLPDNDKTTIKNKYHIFGKNLEEINLRVKLWFYKAKSSWSDLHKFKKISYVFIKEKWNSVLLAKFLPKERKG